MSDFTELKTKKARLEFIRQKVVSDDRWMIKGLLTIYEYQTIDEQQSEMVKVHNGVGFSRIDAEILTSFAKRAIQRGALEAIKTANGLKASSFFSPTQEDLCRRKMARYAGQLARIANLKNPIKK